MSKALCCHAFEALHSNLNDQEALPLNEFEKLTHDKAHLPSRAPLFITWNKDDVLRGCIGTFQKQPVDEGVSQFAIVSALEDTRFTPITRSELNSAISVSVTLLDNFVSIKSWDDWTVGKNGLKVSFRIGGASYSGTFLPSVAEEENWDKITTLYYLLRKANYNKVRKESVPSFYTKGLEEGWIILTKYDGLKSSLSYDEFVEIRKLVK